MLLARKSLSLEQRDVNPAVGSPGEVFQRERGSGTAGPPADHDNPRAIPKRSEAGVHGLSAASFCMTASGEEIKRERSNRNSRSIALSRRAMLPASNIIRKISS